MGDILWLSTYLSDASRHFLLSAITASLGSLPIWITLSVYWLVAGRGTRRHMNTAAVYGMVITALVVGSLWALAAHGWLDGYSAWFSAPLGPPLQIDIGPNI